MQRQSCKRNTAQLSGMAILIPIAFRGWLTCRPFRDHWQPRPVHVGYYQPWTAVLVRVGSGLGFLITLDVVIAARSPHHVRPPGHTLSAEAFPSGRPFSLPCPFTRSAKPWW